MDIHCAKCLEPYDVDYVRHELHPGDRSRFLEGAGCESCDFGRSCPSCSGTSRKPGDTAGGCKDCLGGRYLIIHQPAGTSRLERWEYGYRPNVRTIENPEIITRYRASSTRDGLIRSAKAHCPACREMAPPCPVCAGSGALQPVPDGDLRAAASELEASDAEPFGVLARRLGDRFP